LQRALQNWRGEETPAAAAAGEMETEVRTTAGGGVIEG
jgi:hypothetical protein